MNRDFHIEHDRAILITGNFDELEGKMLISWISSGKVKGQTVDLQRVVDKIYDEKHLKSRQWGCRVVFDDGPSATLRSTGMKLGERMKALKGKSR